MKILFIGNSHIGSLSVSWSRWKGDLKNSMAIDFIPLNLCTPYHDVVRRGSGLIKFRDGVMPDLMLDVATYDRVVIVGCFIGGDGLFRALMGRTCFSAIEDEDLALLPPGMRLVAAADGGRYPAPIAVIPPEPMADDVRAWVSQQQTISFDCARQIYADLIAFKIKSMASLLKSRSRSDLYWIESPMPQRSVFSTIWGEEYLTARQPQILKAAYDEALAQSGLEAMAQFMRFPVEFTEDGFFLDRKFAAGKLPVDIHANYKLGNSIIKAIALPPPPPPAPKSFWQRALQWAR